MGDIICFTKLPFPPHKATVGVRQVFNDFSEKENLWIYAKTNTERATYEMQQTRNKFETPKKDFNSPSII